MSAILPTLEDAEKLATKMESFVQTYRARARRIDQIRKMLATLSGSERLELLCESLGTSTDELVSVMAAGARAMESVSSDVIDAPRTSATDAT